MGALARRQSGGLMISVTGARMTDGVTIIAGIPIPSASPLFYTNPHIE
jgi:hypothetical protein